MSGTTVGQAVEVVSQRKTPKELVKTYESSFAAVLPSHITRPETWIRVAQGALKKGKVADDGTGRTELEVAASNNPGVFLATLLDCARQGLEPGTEQYYLTARKVKGQLQILGIRGYQGEIELMYRAGAVSSVIAEAVYTNDTFSYQPGRDEIPNHEIDWDSADRGKLRLVYAYARMKDGGYSKVIVLNRAAIEDIKKFAQGTSSQYSPWNTAEEAMWLKSALHRLQKFVPTSPEYRQALLEGKVARETVTAEIRMADPSIDVPDEAPGEVDYGDDADVIEAEVVEDGDPSAEFFE